VAWLAAAGIVSLALASFPAAAQQRPVTDRDASVRDVAMTPLTDLNLARDPIPEVLVYARNAPYARDGIEGCREILSEVANLDAVLGDDFDTSPPEERDLSVTNLAQRVVGSFIPFRGIIREISGASAREFEFREAIAAGLMRRAYLKGVGQELGCPYPASPATPELVARLNAIAAEQRAAQESGNSAQASPEPAPQVDENGFFSSPVIQPTGQ
jgi:hypothetical protein